MSHSTAVADTRFARRLDTLSGREIAAAGYKGAMLGGLMSAGLPVPAGFVVDTAAYRAFVAETGVCEQVAGRLAQIDIADPHARRQAAADINVLMTAAPLPAAVHDAIVDAYGSLSGFAFSATVAVRSSPASGDTASHLLSQMNDTFLCVRGRDVVLKAVRRCWASAYGERSLAVREQLGLSHAELDMAVIVQQQISATRSGLMITGDPGRGQADRAVIQASYGLGQAPASGLGTQDRYAVDKQSLSILAREINRKEVVIDEAPPEGGTRTRAVSGEQVTRPALLDRELRILAGLGAAIESHLHTPPGRRVGDRSPRPPLDPAIQPLELRTVTPPAGLDDGGDDREVDEDRQHVLDHRRERTGAEGGVAPQPLEDRRQGHGDQRRDRAARQQGDRYRRGDVDVTPANGHEREERRADHRAHDHAGQQLAPDDGARRDSGGEGANQDGLGLRADGVGHVDDRRHEERDDELRLELSVEGADDDRGAHRSEDADEEPRQAVPQPAAHGLLSRAPGPGRAGDVAAEAGHVAVVLGQQDSEHAIGGDQPHEALVRVDDHDAAAAVADHRVCRELLIGVGRDRWRLTLHELADGPQWIGLQQGLHRRQSDGLAIGEDHYVLRRLELTAAQRLADLVDGVAERGRRDLRRRIEARRAIGGHG
jgi:phosphoenolpyruvate synthase/pyruvate phosphate dikinase